MSFIYLIMVAFPLLLLIPLVEHKAKMVIGFLLLGCLCTILSIFVSDLLLYNFAVSLIDYKADIAPIVEECLKGIPIIAIAFMYRNQAERQSIVIRCAIAIGFGFALCENVWLIATIASDMSMSDAILRSISTTLLHGICSYIVATGIYYYKYDHYTFFAISLVLLLISATVHTCYNTLLYSAYSYIALGAPPVIYAGILYFRIMFFDRRKSTPE